MDSVDLQVLRTSVEWLDGGHRVILATIVETWGSSPRPAGAMLAVRGDGLVAGSVSGGCVEDDLIHRIRNRSLAVEKPEIATYGISKDEATRYGLPCGGKLELVLEPVADRQVLAKLLESVDRHELVARTLDLETGKVTLRAATRGDELAFDRKRLTTVHGPRWRLLIIGAGQLSQYLAQMAQALDYSVTVCDPREEYADTWNVPGSVLTRDMPDDVVLAMKLDSHSAVVAVTHDPKLDDLALMEALKSPAFYVGALGSRLNSSKRRERLLMFDLSAAELDRLHGPIGLSIGSKTPPEIAVSILAEMTAVRHGLDVGAIGARKAEAVSADGNQEVCVVPQGA
ncbi:MAG TPA: XdhC family protein [Burkholderiales bacterium]|jgi:xanthine dehydrogenase accessory factor|nr:XdhC family protein [Burkholderiales bacterium]